MEVGKYWNDNNTNINRAMTHFMSGKSLGGGIAWRGVLCNTGFNYNIASYNCALPDSGNYGGVYGVSGGLSNIALNLGTNHPYGVQPERVPNVMRDHVEQMASYYPNCIIPAINDLIFKDGFDD